MTYDFGHNLRNTACYRLGSMLYIEIKKGKEEMKALDFQQNNGGMSTCMKIIIRSTVTK